MPLHPPQRTGFTLVELMVSLAVAALLAAIAYPSFQAPLRKARRSDALQALLQLQGAQERWRSEHPAYASLSELSLPPRTAGGHYQLRVDEPSASGFAATAEATGAQARDPHCRVLRLRVLGGNTLWSSGPDESAANPADTNRHCWNQ